MMKITNSDKIKKIPGMLYILVSFVPWIVYWILLWLNKLSSTILLGGVKNDKAYVRGKV